MAFDLPASPNIGDLYTDATSGAVYKWNGYAWIGGVAGMGGYLPLSGGVMTGPLTPAAVPGLVGTTSNNNAAAGSVGEVVSANPASTVVLSNGVWANIVSISLSAGDWNVWGQVQHTSSVSSGSMQAAITLVSATSPSPMPAGGTMASIALPGLLSAILAIPIARFLFAVTTTVYLIGQQGAGSGTLNATANSFIMARRTR